MKEKTKRFVSGFLALLILEAAILTVVYTDFIISQASTFTGKNIWVNGAEVLHGRKRNWLYRWTDGWQMTFCICPRNHMGNTVTASPLITNINDSDIPYVKSKEDYEKLAMMCSWFDTHGSVSADNATYAAVQAAVWAIMEDGWESADSVARIVDKHVAGTYEKWKEVKAYVEDRDSGGDGLPDWCSPSQFSGKAQAMTLENGVWTAEMDVSSIPQLGSLNWVFEGDSTGWSKSVSEGKMKFSYEGGSKEPMTISAVLPYELKGLAKNTSSLNFFIPDGDRNTIQAMISSGPYEAQIYIHLSFTPGNNTEGDQMPEVHIYRHSETFTSHYQLELKKSCAETGQALEGSVFQVLEAFDESQIGDGLELGQMTPKPSSWEDFKICSEAVTESGGHVSHGDKREYEYCKTYCDGHPEPEYLEVPQPSEDEEEDNSDEIEAVEAANEELRAQWEALIAACEEETDFHGMEQGEGLEMMRQDRDRLYEAFIHLEYEYTVREIQARYGYLRHGLHPDDGEIPVVRMVSSEAGAMHEIVDREVIVNPHGAFGDFKGQSRLMGKAFQERGLLPEPVEDDVEWVEPAGMPDKTGYLFQISDHRTEGEIHVNKRDLELKKEESSEYDSYGDTQGDATLEGAVYGLYAAEPIYHPDGKSGIIYEKDELTAIATTNMNGDASFLAYTEESLAWKGAWIGRPLILGQYYIKEIARSEGYELSVYGTDREVSNVHTKRADVTTIGKAKVITPMTHPVDMHDGSWLEFDVVCEDTAEGYDLFISGYPEGAVFYRSSQKETTALEQVVVGSKWVATGEYEKAFEGEYRLDAEGNYIPVLDSHGNPTWDMDCPVSRTYYTARRLNYYPSKDAVPQVDTEKWENEDEVDTDYVMEEANSMLEQKGYDLLDTKTGQDAPWVILELSGETNRELTEEILDWFVIHSFWDSAAVHKIWQEENQYKAAVFLDYQRLLNPCIYEEASDTLYVRTPIKVEGKGERHTFVSYKEGEFTLANNYATILSLKQATEEIPLLEEIEPYLKPSYRQKYEQYKEGDYRLDGNGNKIPVYQREFIYGTKEQTTSDYELTPLPAVYDTITKAYRIHVDNRTDWNVTRQPVAETIRAVSRQTEITWNGKSMFYSDYLTNYQGAGASAFAPSAAKENSYIKFVPLTYPGQISPVQDGEGMPGEGTRKNPVSLQERIIKQTVKVIKDVKTNGNSKIKNFRFCIYLKSNLERLYRDKEGKVVWMDLWGQETDVERLKKNYPELVPAFYTKISDDTKPVLETVTVSMEDGDKERQVEVYNYEKFFHGILVANEDKWRDSNPSDTSYRPIGNERNRTKYGEENSKCSDMVRQFAITWYLKDEVKKLYESQENFEEMAYGDERYDQALFHAIERANDYLKPFFNYDLDKIYAIEWDSEEDGGKDKDKTTLSADLTGEEFCYGVSEYLPYGTYVVAEQQPKYAELEDLPNRHYQIDTPKEITLPSVYAGYEASCQSPEDMSSYYLYDTEMTPEEMTEKYLIRFCEEQRVIKAHNYQGDFEIYPFGRHVKDSGSRDRSYGISEHGGFADGVLFYGGTATEDNPGGRYYKDQVPSMTGVQTMYDKCYASVLVPWSVTIPEKETDCEPEESGESSYQGFAYAKFRNLPYKTRLRIEKLDSETHENLLHDDAIFRIYKAEREDSRNGTGNVKFYKKDTIISGSKEFLEAMGATNITSMARNKTIMEMVRDNIRGQDRGVGNLYTGMVPTGTPVCKEEGQVCMTNEQGIRIGEFQSYTTARDGLLQGGDKEFYGEQNTGYLETPKPLDAGAYVLAEVKAPAGYIRSKPVAMEIYSDKVTYYKEGNPMERIAATIYDSLWENSSAHKNKPEDWIDMARIYIENQPVKFKVEKQKESSVETEVTWQISGRIDGTLAEIGNNSAYEYAFLNGDYQGYAWKKGTLEYLQALKDQGEEVTIVYHGPLFAGYGYITRKLETGENKNPYVPGATMTLFEGLELEPSGNSGDYTYKGLVIERAPDQTVTRMYVKKGYGGSRTEFLSETEENQVVWTSRDTEREDTDILYYDFGDLDIRDRTAAPGDLKDGNYSMFVFRGGIPYLELEGENLTEISYSQVDKQFTGNFAKLQRDLNGNYTFREGVLLYHLDEEGNRDSLVDPDTGMAYVLEETKGIGGRQKQSVLVWPVKVARDSHGIVIGRDKITTFRIATVGENQENRQSQEYPETGYITGSWSSQAGEKSHISTTIKRNLKGQNLNGQVLLNENPGSFEKIMSPNLNEYGLVKYYRKSNEVYHKRTSLYDRDGDFVREKPSDLLRAYNQASYHMGNQTAFFHRQGEGYILENTWITGDKMPNDPFQNEMTDGQGDILKRVPTGTYILEEVKAPDGYKKGFPTGVTVKETGEVQSAQMIDKTIKLMIGKIDGTPSYSYKILDMRNRDSKGKPKVMGTATEGKGTYGQTQLPGAKLALYKDRLEAADTPAAQWTTSDIPFYLEGISAGEYVLEETEAPSGFVPSLPVKISVENAKEVQVEMMYNDHTKVEIDKYTLEDGSKKAVGGAGFHLYPALTDSSGQIILKDGFCQYEETNPVDSWKSSEAREYAGFITAFEEMYRDYGIEGETVSWESQEGSRKARRVNCEQIGPSIAGGMESIFPTTARLQYQTQDGKEIRITVYGQQDNRQGRDFIFEYQFDCHSLPQINEHAISYFTIEGIRRFDYLPIGQSYVLVETEPPSGFAKAENLAISVESTADIQRYGVLNQEGRLLISKTGEDGKIQLAGARLALYQAAEDGGLIQDDAYLAATWTSGTDGVYTELEQINHQIPEGYSQGDLRLHTLKRLPDGIYYLVELEAPDYYTAIEPIKIEYKQQQEVKVIQAVNRLTKGELEIEKVDAQGEYLAGAVFQLEAYRKSDLETPVYKKTYGECNGVLRIKDLEIGEVGKDKKVTPYVYKLRELVPPEGYQVNTRVYTFEFQPNGMARQKLKVVNHKTRIHIQKKDFQSAFLEGAELDVYLVTGRDEKGQYRYDESSPLYSWTTKREETTKSLEGLIGGQTYILVERKAPDGYGLMNPIAFTISMDGKRIVSFDNRIAAIALDQYPIEALTIQGRYGVKVEMSIADSHGKEIAAWTASGDGFLLPETTEIPDREICTITETTVYSDGSREVTGKTIKPLFWENGICQIPDRTAEQVVLELVREDGTQMGTCTLAEESSKWTIENAEAPESLEIKMYNRNSRPGNALDFDQEVFNQITYMNTCGCMTDLKLFVTTDLKTRVIDSGEGRQEEGGWIYEIKNVKPLEQGQIILITEVDKTALESKMTAELTVEPAAENRIIRAEKTVPVLQKGKLTVFSELTGSGKELYQSEESTFEIHLYTMDGEELKGSYAYQGSKNGSLKSGENVSLEGNQYITIDMGKFYPDFQYKVIRQADGKTFTSWNAEGRGNRDKGACAVFTRNKTDHGKRILFVKGQSYILKETTIYSDGARYPSNQIQFQLNDEAGVDTLIGFDRKTQITISKEDVRGNAVSEAKLQVTDKDGKVLEEWISQAEPYTLLTVLEKGKTYICRELLPPEGYGYSADIPFTVSEEGSRNRIVMVDRETEVWFRKTDITGSVEVAGAEMQILDMENQVIESWISTDTPHQIKGKLIAGKEYILHEEYPPKGYAYGEDIRFAVPLDGKPIQVEMKDKVTHVAIKKTDITGEEEVPGAWLQIIGPDKLVVEEWESGTGPHEIVGKLEAGKEYVLCEKSAPKGYGYAENIAFLVSKDGTIDTVIMKDEVTCVQVRKTDITGEKEVEGAILQIFDSHGQIVEAWVSDSKPHEIIGKLNANETYILHEEYAPGGYSYSEDVSFTVSLDGRIDQVSMKDDVTKLEILKVNKSSGRAVAGAKMQLLTNRGKVVEEWTSTKEPYKIYGKLIAGEEYQIQEVEPPVGYKALKERVSITIPKTGTLLNIKVENQKKTKHPPADTPKEETPKEPEKFKNPRIGRIMAFYKTRLSSKGTLNFGGFKKMKPPKTGDEAKSRIMAVCILWLLSIIGMLGARIFRQKQKRRNRANIKMIIIGCFLLTSFPKSAKAEEIIKSSNTEITVTWEPFIENRDIPSQPEQVYEYDGQTYEMESCQLVSVMTEEKAKEATDTILYEAVEQADTLPEKIELQVTDEETGQTVTAVVPVLRTKFRNWRWVTGFQFPITVQQYDAGLYFLGDIVVEGREESPFSEYKEELLAMIDVNPKFYSIEMIQWTSQPWVGEDGLVYRQATATGQKYVADCQAVYSGVVTIPSIPAVAWQAVYSIREQEKPASMEERKEVLPDVKNQEEAISGVVTWADVTRRVVRVTIGILFLIIVLVIIILYWNKRRNVKSAQNKK